MLVQNQLTISGTTWHLSKSPWYSMSNVESQAPSSSSDSTTSGARAHGMAFRLSGAGRRNCGLGVGLASASRGPGFVFLGKSTGKLGFWPSNTGGFLWMFPETNLMIYGIVCNNTYICIYIYIMRLDYVIDTNPGLITPSSSEFTNHLAEEISLFEEPHLTNPGLTLWNSMECSWK